MDYFWLTAFFLATLHFRDSGKDRTLQTHHDASVQISMPRSVYEAGFFEIEYAFDWLHKNQTKGTLKAIFQLILQLVLAQDIINLGLKI